MSNNSRENILNRIRTVETAPDAGIFIPNSFDTLFHSVMDNQRLDVFKREAELIGATVYLVSNSEEIQILLNEITEKYNSPVYSSDISIIEEFSGVKQIPGDITDILIGIVNSECLVARTGSVLLSSQAGSGRMMNVFPPVHLVLADSASLVDFPENAIEFVQNKYKIDLPSQISFVTGPSRTADIEKTLVMGAHGPKELIIFVKNY